MLKRIITLLLTFWIAANAGAMHIIGGEITYEYVSEVSPGVNRYKFVLYVYRDCFSGGALFDPQASIGVYRGNLGGGVFIREIKAPLLNSTPIPVDTPACVSTFPRVCAERGLYEFFIELPVVQESYIIVYQRCCRNTTIRNIIAPGDVGASYVAEISPLAQQIKNSSPQFKTFPKVVICKGIPLFEDQSATDKDGHQLVYSLCSPLDGGGTILTGTAANSCQGAIPIPSCGPPFDEVPFVVPTFTPTAPMGGSPVVRIDPGSGLITGTPDQLGQFVMGVCVQEFFNGQLVSTLRREFQFNLADCSPEIFAIVDADTTLAAKVYQINSCGPLSVFIKNESEKRAKITDVRWSFNLNGTPFTSTDFDLNITFPDTGRYVGKLVLNPGKQCADSAQVFINVFPPLKANFSYDYDTCIGGPVTFRDLSTSVAPIKQWFWEFGRPNETSTNQNPAFLYQTPGLKNLKLTIIDTNNCKDILTQPILYQPAPPYIIIQPNSFLGCTPADITFENLSTPIDSTYLIIWDYGDGQRDTGKISPTHKYTDPGAYTVSVYIKSPIGCEVTDTFYNLIRVAQSPTADFTCTPDGGLTQLNNTVQFTDRSLNAFRWGWKFGSVATSTEQNPTYTFRDTGLHQVILTVTHPQGCRDTISKYIDIAPLVNWVMPNAFTPNGDSYNETYRGNGYSDFMTSFRMSIWNRWGELVFETDNPNASWNGTVRNEGTPAPDGVYVYLVEYSGPRNKNYTLKGYVNLIR